MRVFEKLRRYLAPRYAETRQDEYFEQIEDATGGMYLDRECPECGGSLVERGEGAKCASCDAVHMPCWQPGCRGFLEHRGYDADGMAQLECPECGKETEMFDRFGPGVTA